MRLLLILALVAGSLAAQLSPTCVKVWGFDAGENHKLTLLCGVKYDPIEQMYVIPLVTPPSGGEQIAAGQGIILTRVPNQPTVISVETAAFVMVVPAPAAGGECKASTPASSQYVFAADASYMYVCVPNSAEPGKWRWGRMPLQFDF